MFNFESIYYTKAMITCRWPNILQKGTLNITGNNLLNKIMGLQKISINNDLNINKTAIKNAVIKKSTTIIFYHPMYKIIHEISFMMHEFISYAYKIDIITNLKTS